MKEAILWKIILVWIMADNATICLFDIKLYLNQGWFMVNWTILNKFQGNSDQNTTIFIQKNTSENVVCKMTPISSRP